MALGHVQSYNSKIVPVQVIFRQWPGLSKKKKTAPDPYDAVPNIRPRRSPANPQPRESQNLPRKKFNMPSQPSSTTTNTGKPSKPTSSSSSSSSNTKSETNLKGPPSNESGYEGGSETEMVKLHRVIEKNGKTKQVYKLPEEAVAAKVVAAKTKGKGKGKKEKAVEETVGRK
ncbi:hypothetical protein ACMFMG_006674 [Clarireedia jacksonii]